MKVEIRPSTRKREWGYYEDKRQWISALGKSVVVGRTWRSNRRASDLPNGHSICYLSIEDESLFDNLVNRRTRPHTALKPHVAQALRDAGVEFTSLRWSQKAGCSCPCSPGFILVGNTGKDYWATITADVEAALVEVEALA